MHHSIRFKLVSQNLPRMLCLCMDTCLHPTVVIPPLPVCRRRDDDSRLLQLLWSLTTADAIIYLRIMKAAVGFIWWHDCRCWSVQLPSADRSEVHNSQLESWLQMENRLFSKGFFYVQKKFRPKVTGVLKRTQKEPLHLILKTKPPVNEGV